MTISRLGKFYRCSSLFPTVLLTLKAWSGMAQPCISPAFLRGRFVALRGCRKASRPKISAQTTASGSGREQLLTFGAPAGHLASFCRLRPQHKISRTREARIQSSSRALVGRAMRRCRQILILATVALVLLGSTAPAAGKVRDSAELLLTIATICGNRCSGTCEQLHSFVLTFSARSSPRSSRCLNNKYTAGCL